MNGVVPLLAASGLGVTFPDGTEALREVALEVGAGEMVTIVGPSGCGKSTLLRAVAGLVEWTEGELSFAGPKAGGPGTRLGFVFQEPNLLPWRTALGNVALPLELTGVTREAREASSRAALERVGLAEFEGARPRQLSGGMRMRVSLARALVDEPDLLLLDEPFGALDEITRQRLNEELLGLWRASGWTALFVTHNVFEAVFLGQRVLVMSERPGRFVAEVEVPFPPERSAELRADPEFTRLAGEVSRALRRGHAA